MGRTPGAKNKVKEDKVAVEGVEITTINGNKRFFAKVSSAKFYQFASGQQLQIDSPRYLNCDEGGHRIICADGTCFYINPHEGWFIQWFNMNPIDEYYRF